MANPRRIGRNIKQLKHYTIDTKSGDIQVVREVYNEGPLEQFIRDIRELGTDLTDVRVSMEWPQYSEGERLCVVGWRAPTPAEKKIIDKELQAKKAFDQKIEADKEERDRREFERLRKKYGNEP